MIDLSQHTQISSAQNANFHVDSKLVAIHGIDITSTNNIKDTLSVAITTSTQTTITFSSNPLIDWTGYVGFITIEDEILYVTSATTHSATVLRGQYGTVATTHLINTYVYTITPFKNVMSYNWSQSIGVSDRDLFSIDIENGRVILDDISSKWNRLASNCEYAFKRNKEIFIWEGCNGQITKVWEGLTKDKNDSAESNEIIIEIAGYFNKFADEPIKPVKIYDDIRPKELLESLFVGYTAKYVGNTDANDYFKIYNLSTTDFATHRDFINYICKEYAIRLLFRKDKTIHIISDMYVAKLNPIDTIQTEVTKINNDSSGNIIINTVTGTYKERAPLKNVDYTPVRFRHYREFNAPITPIPLLLNGLFQEITLTGLSYAEINTMTYQEFLMIEEITVPNSRRFMCQLTDIIKVDENNYTVKILAGYDKIKNWNERGRTSLQGDTSISNTYRLHWSFDEFPIIWKYGRNIEDEDITSNLMFPLYPNEDYTFYINSFGVGDRTDSKFSGIVKGFESLLDQTFTNTYLKYNDEYAQNELPIYLYTNKIASTLTVDGRNIADDIICIKSIDNSNVELQINYSDIKDSLYKLTLKNTLTEGTTNNITPISTLAGQRLIELSLSNYNLCNVGDGLRLQAVAQGEDKYATYSSYKEARYLITSKFEDSGKYYIYLNDYYPLAETTEFTFVRYDRSTMILLNELYFRSNPVMEAEISYDFTHAESIEEFGTREYTIEGKSIIKDDFLKITSYLKDSYNGFDINAIRNKLRIDMMRRVDLEAGDCINITDSVYTQYENQKVLITKKEVSVGTNGERDESYEMITIGNYSINPDVLLNQQIISWEPDVDPQYNNSGTEGTTKQNQDKQIDNKRLVLQDDVEGQIYVEELPYATFSALTVVTTPILSTTTVFELGLRNLTNNEYRQSLLPIDTPLIIKINSEYLSCKSLGYDDGANTASLQIIKRQVGNSTKGEITSNLKVQFFKILGKLSPQGLTSKDVSIKTGDNNYIEVHTETGVEIKSNKLVDISNTNNFLKFDNSGHSYIRMNQGTQQIGRISGLTGKSDFNGMFLGDKVLANNKHIYYDGSALKIAGDIILSASSSMDGDALIYGTTASTVVSNAQSGSDAWGKFSGVGSTLPSGNVEFNFATSSTKGGNATNTDNVGTQSASAVQDSTLNFNGRNDRNATAIVIPTINSDGTAIDHTVNTDSTSNISFEWNWAGTNADIDGFIVFIRQKSTTSSYTFGSAPSEEQVFYVTPEKRAFILYGVPVNQFYHFGIQAYRIVDTDINANNVIKTEIVQPSVALENPYQPSTSVAFNGDVNGTIAGSTSAATVVSNALAGATAYTGTSNLRTDSPPTDNATFGIISNEATSDGNIVVTIPYSYSYTQGALKADSILIYMKEGNTDVTTADTAYVTKAISGSMIFTLKPLTTYRFGLQTIRTSESGTQGFPTITQSSNFTTIAGTYTGKVDTSNVANKLYWGSDIKIGKDAYGTNMDGISITTNGYLKVANNKNDMFFDPTSNGDNSYLKLNKSTNYYSQQIGKVTEKSSGTEQTYNGFFFGNPEEGSTEYLKYTSQGLLYEGKYFNKTAYCNTALEFIGALNTTKATILYNSTSETNLFYNLVVNKIILTNPEIYDLSPLDVNHFGITGYIIPSENVKDITSIVHKGQGNYQINCSNFGIIINYSITISNLYLINLGSSVDYASTKYAIYINSKDVSFSNIYFHRIKKPIYSNINNSYLNSIYFNGIDIYLSPFDVSSFLAESINSLFSYINNINNIVIMTSSSIFTSSFYLFSSCKNINNFQLNTLQATTPSDNQRLVAMGACSNITNSTIQGDGLRLIFSNCNNISNTLLYYDNDMTSLITFPNQTWIIVNSNSITNFKTINANYCPLWFDTCSYLNNIQATTVSTQNAYGSLTKVDANTVSW